MQAPSSPDVGPYRRAVPLGVVVGVLAAIAVGIVDAMPATDGADFSRVLWVTMALYGLPGVCMGLLGGLILGAIDSTFGAGALRRGWAGLRNNPEVDRNVLAGLMAASAVALILAGLVAAGAMVLVAGVERKIVGAALLGVVMAAALPGLALVALPIYDISRRLTRFAPRIGPVPATVLAVGVAVGAGGMVVVGFISAKLDTQALNLKAPALVVAFVVLAGFLALGWRTILARFAERIPARGALGVCLGAVAFAVFASALRGDLPPEAAANLAQNTAGANVLIKVARGLCDGDGDGYSALLGGPDCDDENINVHPGAREIPGNGLDDNCIGGDRALEKPPQDYDEPQSDSHAAETVVAGVSPNVLVIAIDTLRSDRLGSAGYRREGRSLTPRLDAFVKESVNFTHTYAQAPNTPRSFPSMFNSRYPSKVAVDKSFKNYSNVQSENESLWEALKSAGVRTIGFSSHFYFTEDRGIRQGFDEYDNEGAKNISGSNKDIASPRTVPKVQARLAKLAADKTRFGMFVHLFEPHSTYVKHPQYPVKNRGVEGLKEKYDWEIAFTDEWVGKLLDTLKGTGLDKNTIVVIVSDHGEAFGAHRYAGKKMFFHGQTLYDELLRVPFIVRAPTYETASVDQPVMLIDVAPTIAGLMGVGRASTWAGANLAPGMHSGKAPLRHVYGELIPAPSWPHAGKMVVDKQGKYKLLYFTSDKRFELYDLSTDPTEQTDLYKRLPEVAAKLKDEVTRFIEVEL